MTGAGAVRGRWRSDPGVKHPVNIAFHEQAPLGARIADRVTGFMGSWRFLILQTVVVALWMGGNAWLLSHPFDPAPFILLNLAFSTQAAYAAPLILLAGNRQSIKDRMTLEHTAAEADKADQQNLDILNQIKALEQRILEVDGHVLAHLEDPHGH